MADKPKELSEFECREAGEDAVKLFLDCPIHSSNLDRAALFAMETFNGGCDGIICAYAFLGERHAATSAVETAKERLTEKFSATTLNATSWFSIENILRQLDWYGKRFSKGELPYNDGEISPRLIHKRFTEGETKRIGFGARFYFDGLRFIEDAENGRIKGTYTCHSLELLKILMKDRYQTIRIKGKKINLPSELGIEAEALLESMPYRRNNSPEYVDFIRKKVQMEERVARICIDDTLASKGV